MKEVFRNCDSAWVGLYESILEDAGIATFTYNLGTLQMPVAGLAVAFFPLPIFFPTLCVLNDEDYLEAMQILERMRCDQSNGAAWTCRACNEAVPGNFSQCWHCDSPEP